MDFHIYRPDEMLADTVLTDFILDTIVENLSWLFGDDMGSAENREKWISYNLRTESPVLHAAVAEDLPERMGFILYAVEDRRLVFHDVEIAVSRRFSPKLLLGLFRTVFLAEDGNFDTMGGYINRRNGVSLDNFIRYATSVGERERGCSFVIDAGATREIIARVCGRGKE